jgi:sortase A
MTVRARRVTIVALALLGAWQLGAGVYIHAKAWLAQQLIATAWAKELNGERQVRPWPWADTWPIARLRIPSKDVDLYVLADASGRTLAFGPGWIAGTAQPGSGGNTMLAAHRDTHFEFLRDIPLGSVIRLETADGNEHYYSLTETRVIDTRFERIDTDVEHAVLTLLTCYPFDALVPGGPLRYVAIAEEVTL